MLYNVKFYQCNVKITEHGDEIIEYIPGVTTTCIADLPAQFFVDDPEALQKPLEAISQVVQAQYLLFSSVYELDPQAFEAFKAKFGFPITLLAQAYLTLNFQKHLPLIKTTSIICIG